jgi:Vam6/Vps39-like protein vacuolar protein sorting-associated protein 39
LYGGPAPETHDASPVRSSSGSTKEKEEQEPGGGDGSERVVSPAGSMLTSKLRTGLGALLPSAVAKDDDTASITGSIKQKRRAPSDDFHRSVDTLLRFLTDRRPKLAGALAALKITPSQAHTLPFLSTVSNEEIFQLPNAPLTSLSSEQLLRYAQVVDTVLFKSYLVTRPVLLGSLVRVSNWCEVSEVEGELRAREVTSCCFSVFDEVAHVVCRNLQSLSTYTTANKCMRAPWSC